MREDKEIAAMLLKVMDKLEGIGLLMLAEQVKAEDPKAAAKYVNTARERLNVK